MENVQKIIITCITKESTLQVYVKTTLKNNIHAKYLKNHFRICYWKIYAQNIRQRTSVRFSLPNDRSIQLLEEGALELHQPFTKHRGKARIIRLMSTYELPHSRAENLIKLLSLNTFSLLKYRAELFMRATYPTVDTVVTNSHPKSTRYLRIKPTNRLFGELTRQANDIKHAKRDPAER